MPTSSSYTSRLPDSRGYFPYSAEDDAVWGELFERQMQTLPEVMVPAYLNGIAKLGLSPSKTPQVIEIDARLRQVSGAGVQGVPAIIPPSQFYALLSQRRFPVATFLRRREDMDYIEEPDLFHEVFGHCPLLTDPDFADFIERFGKTAVRLGKSYRWHLFRLFWFTVEFGLINTEGGVRGYGAGIASSPAEAANAIGPDAVRRPFDLLDVFRTPYRIDIVQPLYFVIDSFADLSACLDADIAGVIDAAKAQGDHAPLFPPKEAA